MTSGREIARNYLSHPGQLLSHIEQECQESLTQGLKARFTIKKIRLWALNIHKFKYLYICNICKFEYLNIHMVFLPETISDV